MHFEVTAAAREQMPVLANLLELYVHEFSEFLDVDIGDDGRFTYPNLAVYWSKPHRHPFLFKVDGKLAGFALVKRGSEVSRRKAVWDMAEFFVLRRYRRRGLGTQMAHEVFRGFPGPWEVRVTLANVPAYHFWTQAIARFSGNAIRPAHIDKHGRSWQLFSFESKPGV
ncbi:MAG TPA: GNAT family N-acetyltransferase [Candidatus Sulfotelmatobacter sp.]